VTNFKLNHEGFPYERKRWKRAPHGGMFLHDEKTHVPAGTRYTQYTIYEPGIGEHVVVWTARGWRIKG
jgi:hypothetical protein